MWTYKPGKEKQFKVLDGGNMTGLTRGAVMEVLKEEVESSRLDVDPASITPEHYSFELVGSNGKQYKLHLTPWQKTRYLLNGYARM